MTQERDEYMRRQETDHDLLRMRNYTQMHGRGARPLLPPQALSHEPVGDNDPCDEMVTDKQVGTFISTHANWDRDPHSRAAAIWGIDRHQAKTRMFRWMYGG